MEFKYRKTEGGDIEDCDSCQMPAPVAESEYSSSGRRGQKRLICEICACSFIGNATDFLAQTNNVSLFQSIAQVGNMLLDKLTDRRKELL